jgi:hypothetical protein
MFFPDDINVTKKGINIPWHIVFDSSSSQEAISFLHKTKKNISNTKSKRQLKKTLKSNASSVLSDIDFKKTQKNFSTQITKPTNLFPELIFPAHSTLIAPASSKDTECVDHLLQNIFPKTLSSDQTESTSISPASSKDAESFDHFLQNIFPKALSSDQTDLLQKTIDLVQLDLPSSEKLTNRTTFTTQTCLTNSDNLFSSSSKNEFAPENSASRHTDSYSNLDNKLQQKKLASALNQLLDTISKFQKNVNNEFDKFQNDLKTIVKTFSEL